MQTKIEQKFILPDLDLYTKKWVYWNGQRIKTVFIIHLMDQFLSKWAGYRRDWIRLNSRILKSQYGSLYVHILDWLIQHGQLELWKNYSVGIKSKTYRLTASAKAQPILAASIEVPTKLVQIYQDDLDTNEDWIKLELIESLKRVQIDRDHALAWCDRHLEKGTIQHLSNTMSINRIHSGTIYSHWDRWGRLHTNFTSLKKELRQGFLSVNGNKLVELDIQNSQPFFLWLLMRESGSNGDKGYTDAVFTGKIYEQLATDFDITRKEAKVLIYRVLFGRNRGTKCDQWFQKAWPETYKWIIEFKKECKSYKALAQQLQFRESQFIFHNLIPEIYSWHKLTIVTVHDSIMFEEKWLIDIKKIFDRSVEQLVKTWLN